MTANLANTNNLETSNRFNISTGYSEMDEFLGGGFSSMGVHLLVGRTNIGKSIFLQNFAFNAYDAGYNTLFISLEMTQNQTENQFNNFDKTNIERSSHTTGKLLIKNKPPYSCTVTKIKDIIIGIEEEYKIKINFLVIDYLNLIQSENKNISLYEKGKEVIEGLRSLALEQNIGILTATQARKSDKEISLGDLSESKAVPDTVDTIWAIEQTSTQRMNGIYYLRHLKNRAGRIADKLVKINYDYTTLKIKNVRFEYEEEED